MIQPHSKVDIKTFEKLLNIELLENPITSYLDVTVLKWIYNVFTWKYRGENISNAFTNKDSKVLKLFKQFNLEAFISNSIMETTIVFYNKLSSVIDIRSFSIGVINKTPNNKRFIKVDFKVESLYNIYKNSIYDIPTNFKLFNTIFKNESVYKSLTMSKFSDVTKLTYSSDFVRPDFSYKFYKKKFYINSDEDDEHQNKQLIVIQDCTLSLQMYKEKLKVLKAYILDSAFKEKYEVNWIEAGMYTISDKIITEDSFDGVLNFTFSTHKVEYSALFKSKNFINKKLVIITDGTDDFNFDFSNITQQINLITFNENYALKNKINTYGKYFIF